MPRIKVLILIAIVAVSAALLFVYKGQLLNLISGKFLKGAETNIQMVTKPVQTRRVEATNSALPESFPARFPSLAGADIAESYNLVNIQTGQVKEAVIVLTGAKGLEEIKNFYITRLTIPNYMFVQNSDKTDSDTSKTLVFSTKDGLLIIKMEKLGAESKITITHDILAF